ncbi:MAG: hypothetical protein PHF67_01540 [Candidatus Nanoarchaeia archaeon]|nr:hypothetical protein [Candidatus Nanoarchaeia archaeon]
MASFYPRVFDDLNQDSDPFHFSCEPDNVHPRSEFETPLDAFDGDTDYDFLDYCDEISRQARRDRLIEHSFDNYSKPKKRFYRNLKKRPDPGRIPIRGKVIP